MRNFVAIGLVTVVMQQVKCFTLLLWDHVIKGSGEFMEGNSSLYIPMLQKLIDSIVLMDI